MRQASNKPNIDLPYTKEPEGLFRYLHGSMQRVSKFLYELAQRANGTLPEDGSERMTGPLPFEEVPTASLPSASAYPASIIWDSTAGVFKYSDGSVWQTFSSGSAGVPPLTDSHIYVGNSSNVATDVAMSGDITISDAGATTIGANKVSNSKLAQAPSYTLKGNSTGSTANEQDLTVANLEAMTGLGPQFVTTKQSAGKAVVVAASGSQTLLSYSGRGHIKRIWFAINTSDATAGQQSTISVTRDGEMSPSINLQLQDWFDTRALPSGYYFISDNYGGFNGASSPDIIQIDIPFESSISVSFTNSSATHTTTIWWQIEYQDDAASVSRGPFVHLNAATVQTSVAAYAEQTLINIGSPCVLAGVTGTFTGGDSNYNYLEGLVQAYLNGEGTASWKSSGTEDFFQTAGFGKIAGPATNIALDYSGIPYSDDISTISFYRWFLRDQIYGSSSLKLTWQNGISTVLTVTNNTSINLVIWYYTGS